MNQVSLTGHVGHHAELRYTQSGTPILNFSIATNEYWKYGTGQTQIRTDWYKCVLWGV